MFRTVCSVIVAAIAGAVLSSVVLQKTALTPADQSDPARPMGVPAEAAYKEMIEVKQAKIDELTDANADLQATINALSAQNERIDAIEELEAFADDSDSSSGPDPFEEESPDDDSDRRFRGDRTPPTPEEREEFFNRMRGRMVDMWNEEWEKADADSKARITAISDYQQELMNARIAMRDAETDEDREALRAAMEQTETQLRTTIATEQRAQIRTLAQSHDLSTDSGVDAFVAETRQLMSSPVFNFGGGGWGRGRGDRGGGGRGPR